MTEQELERGLKELLEKDRGVYGRVVAKALAETKLEASEVIGAYCDAIGLRMYQVEKDHIVRFDEKRNRVFAVFEEWERDGETVYSLTDIPQWVFDSQEGMEDKIRRMIEQVIRKKDENADYFVITEDGIFFNGTGYMYIVMTASGAKWMPRDDIERWQEETGLFEELLRLKRLRRESWNLFEGREEP